VNTSRRRERSVDRWSSVLGSRLSGKIGGDASGGVKVAAAICGNEGVHNKKLNISGKQLQSNTVFEANLISLPPTLPVRRGKALSTSGCETHPATLLRPVATRADVEVTKQLKPLEKRVLMGPSEHAGRNIM
jgi:hypothetical protein